MTLMAIKKPMWKNFIVAQAGTGVNGLSMQHNLRWATVQVLIAIRARPTSATSTQDQQGRPPCAASNRSTARAARRCEAVPRRGDPAADQPDGRDPRGRHGLGRERYFGMAIGFAGDPARLSDTRLGDIAVAHTAQDGIVGGFTLRPLARSEDGNAGFDPDQGAPRPAAHKSLCTISFSAALPPASMSRAPRMTGEADEGPYTSQKCLACGGVHLVNSLSGKLMSEERPRAPARPGLNRRLTRIKAAPVRPRHPGTWSRSSIAARRPVASSKADRPSPGRRPRAPWSPMWPSSARLRRPAHHQPGTAS